MSDSKKRPHESGIEGTSSSSAEAPPEAKKMKLEERSTVETEKVEPTAQVRLFQRFFRLNVTLELLFRAIRSKGGPYARTQGGEPEAKFEASLVPSFKSFSRRTQRDSRIKSQ